MSYFERTRVVDNNGGMLSFDAFSRAEVAQPYTIADYTFSYGLNPLLFDDLSTGAGAVTHLPNESSFQLNSGTVSGDTAVFQSRRYHRYQAGKGGKVVMTGIIEGAQTDVTKRWGYFDAKNGLFFQLDGDGTFSVNVRTYTSGSAVTTKVTSDNFNLDPADGTGSSGFTLDMAKANIFEIDFQWLGVGVVTFRIANGDGAVIDLHKFHNPNTLESVYMTTATLPIRYEVTNGGTLGSAGLMTGVCSSVVSSGGEEPPELEFAAGNSVIKTTTSAAETHLVSFRLKSTFNSLTNRMLILPKLFEMVSDLGSCQFMLYLNGTVTGGSWTSVGTNSGVEYNTTATLSAGGNVIGIHNVVTATGPATVNRSFTGIAGVRQLAMSMDGAGTTSDMITITIRRLTATDVNAMAVMKWGEVR